MTATSASSRERSSSSSSPGSEPIRLECLPRFGTPRREGRPNFLAYARLIAADLGFELMPWQEYVIAVATEYDPKTGIPYYRFVWITIPRQSGKTTLLLVLMLVRAIAWGSAQNIAYSSYNGQAASKMLIDVWKPVLQKSAALWGTPNTAKPAPGAGGLVRKLREQSGSEGIDFVNSSTLRLRASGKSSGHGDTLHLKLLDEAMADTDFRREQAAIPAMNTHPDAQLVGVSTAGTADSVLLNARVTQGRQAVADDSGTGTAYFEWSALPGTDILDPGTYHEFMPALGYAGTTLATIEASIAVVASDPEQGIDEARRAYGNIPTSGLKTIFPDGAWELVASMEVHPAGNVTLALDMNPDRTWASVVAADADHAIELIEHNSGSGWIVQRVAEIAARHDAPVVIDEGGPAASFIVELEARGVVVILAKTRDLTQACGAFYDAVIDRTIEVRTHPDATEAVAKARKRVVSESWAWARKVGDHDATPLVAMSLALWGTSHRPVTISWDDDPIVFAT